MPAMMLAMPAAAAPPRRILSLNLCADQLLIELADPGQVIGLTRLARQPGMSWEAARAGAFPIGGTSAEAVLAARPDLILTGWAGQADVARRLGARARVVVVPPATGYADIVAQVRTVAAAVGHPERGVALVAAMDRGLAAIPPSPRRLVAAEYQRGGYMSGHGTLLDEAMRRAGLVNLATRLGRGPLSRLSLEEIVAARPDLLIVSPGHGVRDRGSEMLTHPALAGIRRATLPPAALECGGPSFVAAVRALASAR